MFGNTLTSKNLEEHLRKIRSGEIDPVTKIFWEFAGEVNLKTAVDCSSKGDTLLDIGCGVGNYIIALSKKERKCYGIDPFYEVSLLQARKKAEKEKVNINLVLSTGENLPFKKAVFDDVLLMSTLQHVNNQQKVLSEIKSVLKDDGFLLLTIPNARSISTLFVKIKKPEYFTKNFDLKEVKKTLIEAGFEVLKIRGCGFFPPFSRKILSLVYSLFGGKAAGKMISDLDIFARILPFTASSIIAICRPVR